MTPDYKLQQLIGDLGQSLYYQIDRKTWIDTMGSIAGNVRTRDIASRVNLKIYECHEPQ